MDSSLPSQAKVFREVEQLGLSLSETKPKEHAIKVTNNLKDLYIPDIDYMLEHLHIGPQGPILQEIDNLNFIHKLDLKFTRTFRWSPGYKAQLAKKLRQLAVWDTNPTCAIHRIFEKCDDNRYNMNQLKTKVTDIDNRLREKRRDGLVWLEDPQCILDAMQTVRDKIDAELEILSKFKTLPIDIYIDISRYESDAHDHHGDYVYQEDWDKYLEFVGMDENSDYGNFYNHFNRHYLSITLHMRDFNINVIDTANPPNKLALVPFEEVTLQFNISLNKLLNKMQVTQLNQIHPQHQNSYYHHGGRQFNLTDRRAFVESKYKFTHPYISNHGDRNRDDRWRGVCLGDLDSEMMTNVIRLDIASLVLLFQQWATTYNVGHTNPLNRIQYSHFGMPKGYAEFYKNTVGQDTFNCYSRIKRAIDPNSKMEADTLIGAAKSICDGIGCQLRTDCKSYQEMIKCDIDQDALSDEQKAT